MIFDNLNQVKSFIKLWSYGKTHSNFVLHDLRIDLASLTLKSLKSNCAFLSLRYHGAQGICSSLDGARNVLSRWSDPFCVIEIRYDSLSRSFSLHFYDAC